MCCSLLERLKGVREQTSGGILEVRQGEVDGKFPGSRADLCPLCHGYTAAVIRLTATTWTHQWRHTQYSTNTMNKHTNALVSYLNTVDFSHNTHIFCKNLLYSSKLACKRLLGVARSVKPNQKFKQQFTPIWPTAHISQAGARSHVFKLSNFPILSEKL